MPQSNHFKCKKGKYVGNLANTGSLKSNKRSHLITATHATGKPHILSVLPSDVLGHLLIVVEEEIAAWMTTSHNLSNSSFLLLTSVIAVDNHSFCILSMPSFHMSGKVSDQHTALGTSVLSTPASTFRSVNKLHVAVQDFDISATEAALVLCIVD